MAGRDSPQPQPASPEEKAQQAEGFRAVEAVGGTEAAASGEEKRPLSDVEVRQLRKVFGDGLSYGPIRLVRLGSLITQLNGSRAFVLGNTVNMPAWIYKGLPWGQSLAILVHEAVHVWQYQHQGWGYVAEALWAQSFGGGYDYVKPLRAGKPWRKMNPEQQAQMIQDAFQGGYFDAPGARFGTVGNKGGVVRPDSKPPEEFTDYTSVLVAALEELQKRP